MKHLKPISKAQSSVSTTDIITLITSMVTALVPIVTLILDASATKKQPAE